MFGQNLKKIRQSKGMSINELSRRSGVNASYISAIERDEKKNPSMEILDKLATCLNVEITALLESDPLGADQASKKSNNSEKEFDYQFKTVEAAIKFLLNQNVVMGFGGFDIDKLTEEEIIDFANDLSNQLQLVSLRYKK